MARVYSSESLQIIQDQKPHWRFLLFASVLQEGISELHQRRLFSLPTAKYFHFADISSIISELAAILTTVAETMQKVTVPLGNPYKTNRLDPMDVAEQIAQGCDSILHQLGRVYAWIDRMRRMESKGLEVDHVLSLCYVGLDVLTELETIPKHVRDGVQKATDEGGIRQMLSLVVEIPVTRLSDATTRMEARLALVAT